MHTQCPATDNTSELAQQIAEIRDVLGILALRITMEMEAVRLAALRRDETHVAALAQALADMRTALQHGQSTVEGDHCFHHVIAEATGNPLFVRLLTHLGHKAIPRIQVDTSGPDAVSAFDYLNRLNDEHEAIYEAIARSDAEAASKAMHRHLMGSRHRLFKIQQQLEDELVERSQRTSSVPAIR